MSMPATSKDQADFFWTRVRTALHAMRPLREPGYGQAAMARSMGMRPRLGAMIEQELAEGWAKAADKHVSLSLLVIEIDRASDFFAAYDAETAAQGVHAVMRAITDSLPRGGDSCLRLGPGGFVAVLPDVPVLMARSAALNIATAVRNLSLPNKESHEGVVTVSLGLAVTNPRGGYDKKFFEAGAEALKKAQRKGIGYLHTVDLRPALDRKRKARDRVLKAA